MAQLGADIHVTEEKRPKLALGSWKSYVLVMTAMFFGTIHQSSLGQQAASGSRLSALVIALLLSFVFMGLNLYILRTGKGRSLPELLPRLMPKALSSCVLVAFFVGQILYAGLTVRYQSEGIGAFMLEKTPFDVLTMALLVTSVFLLQRGLQQLANVSSILFWVIAISLAAVFAMAAIQMDWGELRTMVAVEKYELGSELAGTIPLIFNLQLVLFFEGNPAERGRKGLWWATGTAMMMQIVFFGLLVGVFTLAGAAKLHLPIAELIRVTNAAPYSLFERLDVFFLATRTMLVVLNLALWLYAACRSLQSVLSLSGIRILLPAAAVLAFGVSMLGKEVETLVWLQKFAGMLQWILCAGLIPGIALIVFIQNKRGKLA